MWLIRVKPALYLSMFSKIVLFSSETASISSLSSTVEEGLVSFWTPLRLKPNLGEVESANLDLLERIEVLRRSGELRIEWFLESAIEMILPLIRGEGAWIHFSKSDLSRSFGLIFFTLTCWDPENSFPDGRCIFYASGGPERSILVFFLISEENSFALNSEIGIIQILDFMNFPLKWRKKNVKNFFLFFKIQQNNFSKKNSYNN